MLKTKLNGGREAERAVGERSEAAAAPAAPAGGPDPQFVEEDPRHGVIVVLTCVHEGMAHGVRAALERSSKPKWVV